MTTGPSAKEPIACSLEAGTYKERLAWIATLNRAGLESARRDGLRLILSYRGDCAERVREMVRREQQCCGFLRFELTEDLAEARDSVTLVITAPEGAADALDVIFEPYHAG